MSETSGAALIASAAASRSPSVARLRAVSLFAGVGGMDLACEAAGIDVIATAEIDKHAHALLKAKWPERHHYTDVKDVNRAGLLRDVGALPDLVIGGFPCQDLSVAGLQAGLAGERSGLFWEHLRIAKECGARWVVFENVPGLLSASGGRDMGTVLGALVACGYGFAYRVLDAQYFGVPQRRRRVFIVGCLGDDGSAPAEVLALAEGSLGHPAPSRPPRTTAAGAAARGADGVGRSVVGIPSTRGNLDIAGTLITPRGGGDTSGLAPAFVVSAVGGDIAHTLTSEGADASEDGTGRGTPVVTYRKSKRAQSDQDDETWVQDDKTNTLNLFDTGDTRATSLVVPFAAQDQTVRRLTPLECERLQGFPDGWTAGQADSHRYRQMGNAVAVPCVTWFIERLVAVAGVRLPRHDAIVHELGQSVADVRAEVAVALAARDLPGSRPEVIGDADVA